MRLALSPSSVEDYRTFLRVKELPRYRVSGHGAEFPDEYADRVGLRHAPSRADTYQPMPWLFDYQRDIAAMAIARGKFGAFVDAGLGKTAIELEFARHAAACLPAGRCVLIVTPLMVAPQMLEEVARFYGQTMPVEHLAARDLSAWLTSGASRIGITNWEALTDDTPQGRLGAIVADESSVLKSAYGKWGQVLIRLGKGLDWKLAATGTPAPNDRIEFASHAVFLDQFPTVNSFLARYFVNRGETSERWELKPHALRPFYRGLSHWSIFLTNPGAYGWHDNAGTLPPIHVHIEPVDLSAAQRDAVMDRTGTLFGAAAGGITTRGQLSQIAKGSIGGVAVETRKPAYIRALVNGWPGESTIIWCRHNAEQEQMESMFPEAASITGATPYEKRLGIISDFKAGRVRVLISKPRILGLGLNLQICTRQVFNGLHDSYEEFYQCIKRSNRIGSTLPLNVHIPITEIERPMLETVLAKAKRVQEDSNEQERIFREATNA